MIGFFDEPPYPTQHENSDEINIYTSTLLSEFNCYNGVNEFSRWFTFSNWKNVDNRRHHVDDTFDKEIYKNETTMKELHWRYTDTNQAI